MVFLFVLRSIRTRASASVQATPPWFKFKRPSDLALQSCLLQRRPLNTAPSSWSAVVPTMGKSNKSHRTRGGDARQSDESRLKRTMPTHFLCFPIASERTIDQLVSSIAHFRTVSIEPARQPPIRQPRSLSSQQSEELTVTENEPGSAASVEPQSPETNAIQGDPLGNTSKPTSASQSLADSLKVLPNIVHRAPGTYHLTLGVMSLAEPAEMQNAMDLLESLDLKQLLRDAAAGPPKGSQAAREWKMLDKEVIDVKDETSGIAQFGQVESSYGEPQEAESSKNVPSIAGPAKLNSLSRPVSPPPTNTKSDTFVPAAKPQPVHISLTSLGTFPSPKRARVIWAQPRAQLPSSESSLSSPSARPTFNSTEHDRFYNFALHISQAFKTAGLITETRPLVLHATVANMRYKVQAKGGRTTKGNAWTRGRKRWDDGCVDVRTLVKVFKEFQGDVGAAEDAGLGEMEKGKEEQEDEESDGERGEVGEKQGRADRRSERVDDRDKKSESDPAKEFIWCQDMMVDRVAICKMGATKAQDPVWGEWYPPIAEKMIFEAES